MIPARWFRPKCRYFFTLAAAVLLVPASFDAQTGGSVTLRGTVSETVALSVPSTFTQSNIKVESSGGSTVRVTLSGHDDQPPVIRVPLLIRSNSSFKISAVFESKTAVLTQLTIEDARPTGSLVSTQIAKALDAKPGVGGEFDQVVSQPLLVLSGPRVSLGGTLESPNNALQVTLFIRLKPEPGHEWLAHLTFVGTAGSLIQ